MILTNSKNWGKKRQKLQKTDTKIVAEIEEDERDEENGNDKI